MFGQQKSDYEVAKSRTRFIPQRRQYVVCNKCSRGWEWVSNHKTHFRLPGCGGVLAAPSRNASPRRKRQQSQGSQRSGQSSLTEGSIPAELLPLLQDKLPELEQRFPDIAKSVKEYVQPTPAAPAAALHGAQSACQIAFRDLQTAESNVSELEAEASEMVSELRAKIAQLNSAQLALVDVRNRYDEAAKTAQTEVSKHKRTSNSGEDQFAALVSTMGPAQLQEMSEKLAAAAKEAANTAQQQAEQNKAAPSAEAAEQPPNAQAQQPMEQTLAPAATTAALEQQSVQPVDASTAPAATVESTVTATPPQEAQQEQHNAQPDVTMVPTSAVVLPLPTLGSQTQLDGQRTASRSPRRSPSLEIEDLAVKDRKTASGQSPGRRSLSRGSGNSAGTAKSQPTDGGTEHFSDIAAQLEEQLKAASAPRP